MKLQTIDGRKLRAFVRSLEAKHGRCAADMLAESFGAVLKLIPAEYVRRFEEVEAAADLQPGSVLEALLSAAESWWSDRDAGSLSEFIAEGWELEKPATARKNLRALHARWRAEDATAAATEAAARGPETDAEREERAQRVAEIIERDRPANERAKRLTAERAKLEAAGYVEVTMHLHRDVYRKAEKQAERAGVSVGVAVETILARDAAGLK